MSWLISKALMNSLCSQEQEEESLEENFSDGEPSAPLSGNPIQLAYCAPDKMTDFSRLSRFGMTYKPLMESRGEELLTLFRGGFHAKTSQQQEKEMAWTEQDQECGDTWRGWLAKYDPDTSSWKTPQCSLLGEEPESLETLPKWGMTVAGRLWELPTLEPITRGTESGSLGKLPTPQSTDYMTKKTSASWKAKGGVNFSLANPEIQEKWPTPRSCSAMAATITPESAWDEKRNPNLETVVGRRMWASPNARDWKDNGASQGNRKSPNLGTQVHWPTPRTKGMCGGSGSWDLLNKNTTKEEARQMGAGNGGKLNPTWVEWLMGWPLGWTDLKPLVMDKSHSVLPKHGDS